MSTLWFGFYEVSRVTGSTKYLISYSYFIHTPVALTYVCCMLCNFSVENHSSIARKTTGLMNSAVWPGHWQKRLLTCLCKTDRQQTSDIQQWLTWQTGNQQSRYLLIYFAWIKFIWFYVWSTVCPCTVIYCNVLQWLATKCYKHSHAHDECVPHTFRA